ncbi:MAG: hypothetical protein ACHQFX_13180 [Chitinophagales bacterium]
MDPLTKQHFDNLQSKDARLRYASFQYIINLTKEQVEWAYQVWDDLLALTKEGDNHQRTIAVQVLSNLAKSDPDKRMLKDLDKLFDVTKDERFVTARHSLQSLWKIGIVNIAFQKKVIEGLKKRFKECIEEKNCTLIRYDISADFRKMYDQLRDEKVKEASLALIETEKDEKYKKKYQGLWKDVLKTGKEKK